MVGTIKKVVADKGFGFITVEGRSKDLFFHARNLSGVTFESLREGDQVQFDEEEGEKGPMATNVTLAQN